MKAKIEEIGSTGAMRLVVTSPTGFCWTIITTRENMAALAKAVKDEADARLV